jgi:hypothetical protein
MGRLGKEESRAWKGKSGRVKERGGLE